MCQYSLKVLIAYSCEILLRPCMKPAGYFQKDIDILDLLCLDWPSRASMSPSMFLFISRMPASCLCICCCAVLTEKPVVCELLLSKYSCVLPVGCRQNRSCKGVTE